MTAIKYVNAAEMLARTGMPALGYTTKRGDILIRKGLDKKTEREVRAHEAEHVMRGEEGPFLPLVAAIGGSLLSGILGSRSADKAAKAQTSANQAAIDEQRRQFDTIMGLTAPGREVGNQALATLSGLLGLPGPEGVPRGTTDVGEILRGIPGSQGIIDQTTNQIRNAYGATGSTGGNVMAALADRIGSYTGDKVFNSLFQLAGFGPSATNAAASAAGTTGANVGNLLQSSGIANASGILGAGQSQNAALNNILQAYLLNGMGGFGGGPQVGIP